MRMEDNDENKKKQSHKKKCHYFGVKVNVGRKDFLDFKSKYNGFKNF